MTIDDVMRKIDRFNTFDCSGTAWRNLRVAIEQFAAEQVERVTAERKALFLEVKRLYITFAHLPINSDTDVCRECGLDLRHPVHSSFYLALSRVNKEQQG